MTSSSGTPRLIVVGGGVAGLSAARAALALMPGLDVRVLESAPKLGGLVETERTQDGFVIEHGADCIVTSKPAGLATARELGLADALSAPLRAATTTFIARGARLLPLPPGFGFGAPASLLDVLCTRALSPWAKARMALEPCIRAKATDQDESVAAFIARRFGTGFLEQVVAPVLESVYGAPASEISARACLARLRTLEQESGSVVRGLRRVVTQPVAPAAPVVTLREGMGSLVDALSCSLAQRVHTGLGVVRVERGASSTFRVRLRDGGLLETDALIVATPANRAAALIEPVSTSLASLLGEVRFGRLDCVSLGFRRQDVAHPLDGSGFVVPRSGRRITRACSWSSSKWGNRAPQNFVLFRSVLSAPGALDDELLAEARADLAELLGIHAAPMMMRLRRRRTGLPIHDLGCLERAVRMHEEAAALGGLSLAGSAHGAMGVSDCIESGRRAAERVLSQRFGVSGYASASSPPA